MLSFLFYFSMKIKIANIITPDGTPRFAASHLGLFCLPLFHEKDARLLGFPFLLYVICLSVIKKYFLQCELSRLTHGVGGLTVMY